MFVSIFFVPLERRHAYLAAGNLEKITQTQTCAKRASARASQPIPRVSQSRRRRVPPSGE